jgi:signal peptidase I
MTIQFWALVWLAITAWVAVDAERRGRQWFEWAGLVAVTGVFGLAAWLVARRRSSPQTGRLGARRTLAVLAGAIPLFLLTVLLAVVTASFLFQPARIEGQAMAPTLRSGDRVVVNKAAYRWQQPHRHDIVMMYYPNRPEKVFVMRVVAEEGDQVRIRDGRVYVNDVQVDDTFIEPAFRGRDMWGPEVIPEGYYFVMGDNRRNSADSRHWGYVPHKYILGRIALRWWPVSDLRTF